MKLDSALIRSVAIPLAAMLAFWLGGYIYFKNSSNWEEIQSLIAENPAVQAQVGEIKEISVGAFPFSYRFSGDRGGATLRVTVVGTTGTYQATVSAQRKNGVWSLTQ